MGKNEFLPACYHPSRLRRASAGRLARLPSINQESAFYVFKKSKLVVFAENIKLERLNKN